MAKIKKPSTKAEDPVVEKSVDTNAVVKQWVEDHACDRYTIKEVDKNKFRVNLYTESGDTIRVSKLARSFYLVVIDGVVHDKTIRKSS